MQLKISLAAATIISAMAVHAEDYVSVQYLQYNENSNRTAVSAPSLIVNKDFGTDYTLNVNIVSDTVSGASEAWYDSASGASAFSRGTGVNASDVKYGNVAYSDERIAGGVVLTTRMSNRDELTIGGNYSREHDFDSKEVSGEYMHWLDSSKNSSLSFGASYQFNEVLVRIDDTTSGASATTVSNDDDDDDDGESGASEVYDADALTLQLSYFQNLNAQSYFKIAAFYIADSGYLTNPYMNVVRNYNEVTNKADVLGENRPDSRVAYGLSLKYANALTDNISAHIGYRYYSDDWEIDSHTLDSDLYYELGDDWVFKVGLRYYTQSQAKFYNASKDYFTDEVYASSDQRLSSFDAITYKSDVEYFISDALSVNFSANYYEQSTDLKATYFMTGATYRF